jgi:hypothetical protein
MVRLRNHGLQEIMPSTREELQAELAQLHAQLTDLSTADSAMTLRERQAEQKKLEADFIDVLLELHNEVKLGVIGSEGYALVGDSIQTGVAYHMKIGRRAPGESKAHAGRRAALQAYTLLINKLGRRPKDLPYVWSK